MNIMEKYLAEKGTKGEFFLKLENVIEGKAGLVKELIKFIR